MKPRAIRAAVLAGIFALGAVSNALAGSTITGNVKTPNGFAVPIAVVCVDLTGTYVPCGGGGAGGAVTITQTAVVPTDRGGTITTGGTAQSLATSNASRKGLTVENPCSATEDLYISTSTTATTSGAGDDADLAPCGSWSAAPSTGTINQNAVSVIAATTAHRWIATEVQ